ncbi:hypothetical protein VNI00_010999 [Paramarasmius palmivorus]|uniref:Protein kinase domain-containing protein n=1 Tax=Paramarasmius palmivorus TaxID=297713 RepID=A0AAW0CEV9_9AGAR
MDRATTIRIRFPADPEPTTFHYKPPQDGHGRYPELFKPLPVDDQCILEASKPTLRSQKLGPSYTHFWGETDFFGNSFPIFTCSLSSAPKAPILVLKTALHTNDGDPEYIKDRVNDLEKEAKYYADYLYQLQGSFVPEHYGTWESDETSWAGIMKCEIIAYGGKPLWRTERLWRNNPRRKELIAKAAEKLHDWCICHAQLFTFEQIERHILWNKSQKRPMIIDFVPAHIRHICPRCIPLVPTQMSRWTVEYYKDDTMCEELMVVGQYLGFLNDPNGYPEEILKDVGNFLRHVLIKIMDAKGRKYGYLEKEKVHGKQRELLVELWPKQSNPSVGSSSSALPASLDSTSSETEKTSAEQPSPDPAPASSDPAMLSKVELATPDMKQSDSNSSNESSGSLSSDQPS